MDQNMFILQGFKSSNRRRNFWLISIVVFAFICFTTFWNSRILNWNQETIRYLKVVEKYQNEASSLNVSQKAILNRALEKYSEEFVMEYDAESVTQRLYNQDAPFFYVEFPLLGVRFHINDLGLVYGWLFVLLMTASLLALKAHLRNIETLNTKGSDLKELAQMTVISSKDGGILSKLTRIPYLFPFALSILILANDIISRDLGMMISPLNMNLLFLSSGVTLVLILILTVSHWKTLNQIEADWN